MNQRQITLGTGGVYPIGCGNEVVYIGMTNNFRRRTLQSLGRCYSLVKDTTLPWSLTLARWDQHKSTDFSGQRYANLSTQYCYYEIL